METAAMSLSEIMSFMACNSSISRMLIKRDGTHMVATTVVAGSSVDPSFLKKSTVPFK